MYSTRCSIGAISKYETERAWWEEPRVVFRREKDRFCQSFRGPPGRGSDWQPPAELS